MELSHLRQVFRELFDVPSQSLDRARSRRSASHDRSQPPQGPFLIDEQCEERIQFGRPYVPPRPSDARGRPSMELDGGGAEASVGVIDRSKVSLELMANPSIVQP